MLCCFGLYLRTKVLRDEEFSRTISEISGASAIYLCCYHSNQLGLYLHPEYGMRKHLPMQKGNILPKKYQNLKIETDQYQGFLLHLHPK